MGLEEAMQRIQAWIDKKKPHRWLNLEKLELTELPPLPSNLRNLKIGGNPIRSLKGLPLNLRKLIAWNTGITSLEDLPNRLVVLDCEGCNKLLDVNILIDSLYSLKLSHSEYIVSIRRLSKQLRYLHANLCYSLKTVQEFPPYLISCSFTDTFIERLPTLPNKLKYFTCNASKLSELSPLPDSLIDISLFMTALDALPKLPPNVKEVTLNGNHQFTVRPEDIPPGVIYLVTDDVEDTRLNFDNTPTGKYIRGEISLSELRLSNHR